MPAADAGADAGTGERPDAGEPVFFSRLAPHQGLVGTQVTFLGSGFAPQPTDNVVTFNGVRAAVLSVEPLFVVEVPPGSQTGPLVLTTRGQTLDLGTFIVLTGPVLYGSSPDMVVVGSGATTLSLTGDGFEAHSVVRLDGAPLPTTWVSAGRLDATAPSAMFATTGTRALTVFTPPSQFSGGESASVEFTVFNPGPAIDRLTPTTVGTGAAQALTLSGGTFVPASIVLVDGLDVPTTFTSSTSLLGQLPAFSTAGVHTVQVRNPAPGGGVSAPVSLTVE